MEANKRKCRQRALDLFYSSDDALNKKTYQNKKENIPQISKNSTERLKFLTPQKHRQEPSRDRKALEWPNAIFSDSKLKSVANFFEPSEPWYKYEKDGDGNSGHNGLKNNPIVPDKSDLNGIVCKRKLFTSNSNNWFRHEHNDQDLNERIMKNDDTNDSDIDNDMNSQSIKKHSNNEHTTTCMEAEILANKQRMESDNWFDYEANLKWPFHFPMANIGSPELISNRKKNQGSEMKLLLTSPDFNT